MAPSGIHIDSALRENNITYFLRRPDITSLKNLDPKSSLAFFELEPAFIKSKSRHYLYLIKNFIAQCQLMCPNFVRL